MTAFLVSFAVIFVAELGDKSQLMAMTFATRYRFWTVVTGITISTAVIHLLSATVGSLIGAALPTGPIGIVAGLAFVGFGLWTLRDGGEDDADDARSARSGRSAVNAVAVPFFLAELGDKTMLATITLATQNGLLGTWLGATAGLVTSGVLAIAVGSALGRRLPERTLAVGAAVLFFAVGVWLLVEGILAVSA
ncbi:TMEM165/GDT1 family protein [Actinosynnema sp.]|uniref:TMEM165/GDT1 family protein n=1 Tax=Actinosynnema sp. TaxID=1872144 RepID=UPI003F879F1F